MFHLLLVLLLTCANAASKYVPDNNKYNQFNNEYIIKIPLEKSYLEDVQYRFSNRHLIVENIPDASDDDTSDENTSDDEISTRNINILLPEYVGRHCNVYYVHGILEIHMPIIEDNEVYKAKDTYDNDEQFNYTRKCGSCVCWRCEDEQLEINFTEQFPVTTESLFSECTFEDFVNSASEVDTSIKKFCDDHSIASEVYGENYYILKYRLPCLEESNINIEILHRVIQITVNDGNCETWKDMRVLPDILRVDEAAWVLEHGVLKIFIPYKTILGQDVMKTCDDINENILNVPIMVSFGIQFR